MYSDDVHDGQADVTAPTDLSGDLPTDVAGELPGGDVGVPSHVDVLPDGRTTLVFGDTARLGEFNHQQGDNTYGFQGDCGLVSVQDVLNQFGVDVDESDVVSRAVGEGRCDVEPDPDKAGGTTADNRIALLGDYGVPAHEQFDGSLGQLAGSVEQGHAAIVAVNAGVLWNDARYLDAGAANHAVTVTGVARDPGSGSIQGFYVNDSGNGTAAEFVPAAVMEQAWLATGGEAVVSDATPNAGTNNQERSS